STRLAYLAYQLGAVAHQIAMSSSMVHVSRDALAEANEAIDTFGQMVDVREGVRLRVLRAVASSSGSPAAQTGRDNGPDPDLKDSVTQFCEALPSPYRDYADLGRAIHIITRDRQAEWPSTDTPVVALQRSLDRVKRADTLLADLGVNLSKTAYS